MFVLYYFLIPTSIIGYGILLNNYLNLKSNDFGLIGVLGIINLTIISYLSSFFFAHDYTFNLSILCLGIFFLFYNLQKVKNFKFEFLKLFLIFFILLIFVLVAKNHDDFPYYHFPYSIILTDIKHPFGLGLLNNGFRSPSSLFFISSLFYYPKIDYYLIHIVPALILGFSNLIFLNSIFDKKNFKSNFFICILSLIIFSFVNIFFYRLAEHGTDRSGMILIFVAIIFLLKVINNKDNKDKDFKNEIKIFLLCVCFTITIKPFYLIYGPLVLTLFIFKHTRIAILEMFFSKISLICISLILFTFFYTFINSSCVIFPITFTCFENLSWAINKDHINDVKIWFELWSKAGATPNLVVENRIEYIKNFNWLKNWINLYFFNKVSDFILGIIFLSSIFFIFFYSKKKKTLLKKKYLFVYIFLIICLIEWFLNHPTLRYGGYHLIALVIFIPLSIFLEKYKIDKKTFLRKSIMIIMITLTIFLARNVKRIHKEFKYYGYNPLKNPNYKFIGGDKNFYFRYNNIINNNKLNYKKINFIGISNIVLIDKKVK